MAISGLSQLSPPQASISALKLQLPLRNVTLYHSPRCTSLAEWCNCPYGQIPVLSRIRCVLLTFRWFCSSVDVPTRVFFPVAASEASRICENRVCSCIASRVSRGHIRAGPILALFLDALEATESALFLQGFQRLQRPSESKPHFYMFSRGSSGCTRTCSKSPSRNKVSCKPKLPQIDHRSLSIEGENYMGGKLWAALNQKANRADAQGLCPLEEVAFLNSSTRAEVEVWGGGN